MELIINLALAFLEGLGIILSPCILPVLPIVFATGVLGGKNRPYGIMLGFIIAFCLFTLFARTLVLSAGVNLDLIRTISLIALILLSMIMMSTYLSDRFSKFTYQLSIDGASLSSVPPKNEGGFLNGIFIGLPIGLVWTPCAGPIIVAVILQTIRAKTNIETMLTLLVFSLGVAIPILLIILGGKKILQRYSFFTANALSIRKILGGALFLAVILTMQGDFYLSVSGIKASSQQLKSNELVNPVRNTYIAPPIKGISEWINSTPLDITMLKGKVVLVDFWTYSCINCVRTLPYLIAWHERYHDDGLVIIGIHSPEFAFEQKLENVKKAVKQYGIRYPVALDNLFATWDNYQNHYWPAEYLINQQGVVVYTHFGEGQYEVTEHNIQVLLGKKTGPSTIKEANITQNNRLFLTAITPETYLGSERAARFERRLVGATNVYEFPKLLKQNHWALQGKWQIMPQKVVNESKGSGIQLHFHAQKVFLVLSSPNQKIKTATLFLNGKPIGKEAGAAIKNSQLIIREETLYELVNLPQKTNGILEIIFDQPGVEAYAFTFG